jgi:hypothetical protein
LIELHTPTMMDDLRMLRIRAYRQNIRRYRRLLET